MAKTLGKSRASSKAAATAEPVSVGTTEAFTLELPRESPATVKYEFSPPFLFVYAPRRYQPDGDGNVVPQLGKMPIEPGINGVDARGNWLAAKVGQESRGRTVIPEAACLPEDTPDGEPGYLRRTRTASGWYHHTPWERLEVHAGQGRIVEADPDGYRAWLGKLEERGVIPPVHDAVIRRLRDIAAHTIDASSARDGRGAQREVELATRQVAALDARLGAA